MKVLLVKPLNIGDHVQPALGLGYLATAIRNGRSVRIMDCNRDKISLKNLTEDVKRFKPDMAAFQCYTYDVPFTREALKRIKNQNKDILTVIGGPHPSALPGECMNEFHGVLDFAFAGEAETGLPKLLNALEKGDTGSYPAIPGLIWKNKGNILVNNRIFVEDLDSLGFPAWDMIKPQDYPEAPHGAFFKRYPVAPIMTTRGCPRKCTFCAGHTISGRKIRKRSVKHILEEILLLYNEYGIREIQIIDDNFTFDRHFAKTFLKELKQQKLDISWSVPNGVCLDMLDEELLVLMKETGLSMVSAGIESGSDRILRLMRKGITTAEIKKKAALVRRFGMDMAGFFIMGYPGETVDEIKKTISFSLSLGLQRAQFMTYLPLPGSGVYRDLKVRGKAGSSNPESCTYTNAAYSPAGISKRQLKNLQRIAFLRFYMRPGTLIYHFKNIRSLKHLLFLIRRFFIWIF